MKPRLIRLYLSLVDQQWRPPFSNVDLTRARGSEEGFGPSKCVWGNNVRGSRGGDSDEVALQSVRVTDE